MQTHILVNDTVLFNKTTMIGKEMVGSFSFSQRESLSKSHSGISIVTHQFLIQF